MTIHLKSLFVLGVSILSTAAALAQQSFATTSVQIRAGVLVVQNPVSGIELPSPTPHVWFALDRDRAIKPANWSFDNPRSTGIVSRAINNRWSGNTIGLGQRMTKMHAGYWEVSLNDASDNVLSQYDILLMSVNSRLGLSPKDREKLRRYVDQGGLLWIDVTAGASADTANPAPIPFAIKSASGPLFLDVSHPILSTPNTLTIDELTALRGASTLATGPITTLGALAQSQSWIQPDSLNPRAAVDVAADSNVISTAQLGEGTMIISTAGIASVLNRARAGTTVTANTGFTSGASVRDAYYAVAAKLVVNILSLNTTYPAPAGGSRKMLSTAVDVTAPLIQRFQHPTVPTPGTTAVHAHGMVFMVSGGSLIALDNDPDKDLNGDGDPDDGIQNAFGSTSDVLWVANGDFATSPVLADVPGRGQLIFVMSSTGTVQAYAVNPASLAAPALVYSVAAPGAIQGGSKVSAPTIHEGLGYVGDTDGSGRGRMWAFDARTGAILPAATGGRPFSLENSPRMGRPSNSPTVGYIPIMDNSGGVDRVVYIPTQKDEPTRTPAGLTSVWAGARGESPVAVIENAGTLEITTRASLQQLPIYDAPGTSFGVKISLIYNDGRPVPDSLLAIALTGAPVVNGSQNGSIQVPVNLAGAGLSISGPTPNCSVRVDYTLDWAAPTTGSLGAANSDQFVRGNLQFPDQSIPRRDVIGNIALTSVGNVIAVTSPPANSSGYTGGSVFVMREEGRGDFRMLYRWELYDDVALTVNGSSKNYGPSLVDYDNLLNILPSFLNTKLENSRFIGGPVVRGDTAYFAVATTKKVFGQPAPCTALIALDANPQTSELILNNLALNFVISQPDPGRTETASPQTNFLAAGAYIYEQDASQPGRPGRLRINSFMQTTRGRIRDCLAINLPIVIRQAGQSEIIVEPEMAQSDGYFIPGNAAGRWNPLKWYTVFTGLQASGNAMIAGDTLYAGGPSLIPAIINTGNPFGASQGLIFGINTRIAPSDLISPSTAYAWMTTAGYKPRPWQRYLNQLYGSNPSDIRPSPYIVWPSFAGVRNQTDLQIRFNQAVLGTATIDGIALGDGALTAWGSGRTLGFTRGDFLIADEGRILRVDAAGNPMWASDQSIASGAEIPVNYANTRAQVSKASRVYSFGASGYLVVDTGNDRIVRLDSLGQELRTLSAMRLDPNFRPDGVGRNPNPSLRLPRDVVTYTSIVNAANNPFTNAQTTEYWRHWLIADSGNARVIELVDRYSYNAATKRVGSVVTYTDPATGVTPGLGMLLWHTRSELSGRNYAYNSIGRVYYDDGAGGRKPVYAFGFGNVEPGSRSVGLNTTETSVDVQTGNGGIVLYDPAVGSSELITNYASPDIPANTLWNPTTGIFDAAAVAGSQTKKFAGLNSVTLRYDGAGNLQVMVADGSGVVELQKLAGKWTAVWMLPKRAYTAMRRSPSNVLAFTNPKSLTAMYARHLSSGEVIVVNGYNGQTLGSTSLTDFAGEVLMIQYSDYNLTALNLGFSTQSIRFELPPINGLRSLQTPVFADRP